MSQINLHRYKKSKLALFHPYINIYFSTDIHRTEILKKTNITQDCENRLKYA